MASHELDVSAFEAAGLYSETAPHAADRLALLRHLAERGASVEEMRQADAEKRLTWLGVDRMLATADGQPLAEVARRAGLSEEIVLRVQRAMALPAHDDALYSASTMALIAASARLFGFDATLQFGRVIGATLTRMADAAMSAFLTEIRTRLVAEHASPAQRAREGEEATALLLGLPDVIRAIWPDYVAGAVRRFRHGEIHEAGGIRAAIGFIDVVDSTRLVQQLAARDLAHAIGDFESAATLAAHAHDGRVVKFVGDAAMFVAPDPADACAIALEIRDVIERHPILPAVRGAIGFGNVLAQDGDVYGSVVNLTSRLAAVASPGQIVGTTALQSAVDDGPGTYRFDDAGVHRLRGFDEPCRAVAISRADE